MTTADSARKLDAVNDAALHLANAFNNHLTAINGILQNMQSQTTPSPEDLVEALRITRQAAVVVGDLQRTVRPPPPRLARVDPAEVVVDAMNAIRPELPPGVTMTTAYADERASLFADRSQIRDAVVHLLMNAKDAIGPVGAIGINIDPGSAHELHVPPGLDGTEFTVIEVQDNGSGIPVELLPKIHEPFFSTRERPGLGLASVYQTIKQHRGGITVDSELGIGSTFRLFLPIAMLPAVPTRIIHPSAPASQTARILVIDDDLAVRRVVRKCLEREGMTVDEASTGEEGLAMHRAGVAYNAIVLDIIMPGLSGWDVLHDLQRAADQTPVILQSGFMTEVDDDAAQHAAAFLRKPYDLTDLVGAVRGVLVPA